MARKDTAQPTPSLATPTSPNARLVQLATLARFSEPDRESLLKTIGEETMRKSSSIKGSNFRVISTKDLTFMADLYDESFFEGKLLSQARVSGLSFRWSSRMTSAGGKTTRFVTNHPLHPALQHLPGFRRQRVTYEITLSSSLLFQTFNDVSRPVRVCGRLCHNRLEAMQRILEHELTHLLEMIVWEDSNCAANRFQKITSNLFAHTEHRHELITQRERALQQFNIRVGQKVRFQLDSQTLIGIVNRITRRATVLVEDGKGLRFSDGKCYRKYYVPLARLEPVTAS